MPTPETPSGSAWRVSIPTRKPSTRSADGPSEMVASSAGSGFRNAPRAPARAARLKVGVPAGSTVVCVLTGHGLKDPDRAIAQIAVPTVVDADYAAIRAELGL